MPEHQPPYRFPPAALREFKKVSKADWDGVLPLADLLYRVNRVSVAMTGNEEASSSGRVKAAFTERSFRHYQTLGCIDTPAKHGRLASYGFRHFVQALLIRRLLLERVPSEQIATLLSVRDTVELEKMLLGGVEITARPGNGGDELVRTNSATELSESWVRVPVAPGLELHFSSKRPSFNPEDYQRLMTRLKEILKKQK